MTQDLAEVLSKPTQKEIAFPGCAKEVDGLELRSIFIKTSDQGDSVKRLHFASLLVLKTGEVFCDFRGVSLRCSEIGHHFFLLCFSEHFGNLLEIRVLSCRGYVDSESYQWL